VGFASKFANKTLLDQSRSKTLARGHPNGRATGLAPILKRGGDEAEKKFMECCWCLWRANGSELLEPFIEAAFNTLPEKSRAVLFERMLTIVYVAQDSVVKNSTDLRSQG